MLVKVEVLKSNVKRQQKLSTSALFFLLFFCYSITTNAQCAMCRAAIESEGDTTKATALNDGIVYLMAIPYVLVGLVGFAVYKMYANKKKA